MSGARPAGSFERDRAEAEARWNAENPKTPAICVQWVGGDLWRIVALGRKGPGFVDLAPDEPSFQLGLPGTLIQESLF